MRKKLLIVCLCGLSSIVSAAEWYVAASDNNTTFLVDKNTVQTNGNRKTVWQWVIYSKKTQQNFDNLKIRITYDCSRGTNQLEHFASYLGGQLVFQSSNKDPAKPVMPETFDAAVYDFVCKDAYQTGLPWYLDLVSTQQLMRSSARQKK